MKVHDEGDHKCTECSRLFTLKKNLERHMIDAHNKDGVNKFVCDTCVMDFVTKDDLENHIAGDWCIFFVILSSILDLYCLL